MTTDAGELSRAFWRRVAEETPDPLLPNDPPVPPSRTTILETPLGRSQSLEPSGIDAMYSPAVLTYDLWVVQAELASFFSGNRTG